MGETTDDRPLTGVTVVEVAGGIAAAYCTRLLRGYGARVIRWEHSTEQLTPNELTYLVAGKERVPSAVQPLDELVAGAHLLVEDQAPDWLAERGVPPLDAVEAGCSVVSISPFGQTGPHAHWRTTNAVQFAAGGLMSLTGREDRPPLVTGGSQAYYLGGLHAFAASTSLLLAARSGAGADWLDLSMQECAASMPELYGAMSAYELEGEPVVRAGNSVRAAWGVYRASDGWAGVCCLERQMPALFELLGEQVSNDERFTDYEQRADHDDELLAHVMGFVLDHTKAELLELSPRHRVPFGAVVTHDEMLADSGLADRGFFDTVESNGREVTMPGRLFPGLGWDAPHVLARPGAIELSPRPEEPKTGERRRPLEGVRIADLTMMWAGPYCTKLLAEMGAEVIKIESPRAWDNIRTLVPQDPDIVDPWNSAYYFNEYNHSKKSLTIDLADDAGRELFLELVCECDVVIENYRADVLEKLGLSYDVLRRAKDDIVLVTMAGFGKTGPLSSHVGFGPIIEMMSGLMSLTGYGDGEPFKTGISYGDPVGGLAAYGAVNLALLHRDRCGEGAHIDLAQRETAASMAGEAFVAASMGERVDHVGNRSPRFAPQGCYRCAGDDHWLVLSVTSDTEWERLAELVGLGELADAGEADRRGQHDRIDAAIEVWSQKHTKFDAAERLQALGIPAAPVYDTADIRTSPQLEHRGFYVEVPNPKMRPYLQTGPTWRPHHMERHVMTRSPWFGEHNDELLRGLLGHTAVEVDQLARIGVIADAPVNPTAG